MSYMKEDISHSLCEWANETSLSYASNSSANVPITPKVLQKICGGPMADIWKYVVKNVHSKERANHIKNNIFLKKKHFCNNILTTKKEITKISEDSGKLASEIESQKVIHNDFLLSIKNLQEEIEIKESQSKSHLKKIEECQHKIHLFEIYYDSMRSKIQKYKNESLKVKELSTKLLSHQSSNKQNVYVSQNDSSAIDGELEKITSKNIRDTYENIRKYLDLLSSNDMKNKDMLRIKKKLLKMLENIMMEHKPSLILDELSNHVNIHENELKKQILMIDHIRDANSLSFLNENDHKILCDNIQHLVKNSMEKLLSYEQYEYVNKFIEYKSALQEIITLDNDIKNLNTEIQNLLENKCLNDDQIRMIRENLLFEANNNGFEAANKEILSQLEEIDRNCKSLLLKNQKISRQHNSLEVSKKQLMSIRSNIEELMEEHSAYKTILQGSLQEIKNIREEIFNRKIFGDILLNYISRDVKITSAIDLSSLHAVQFDNKDIKKRANLNILADFGKNNHLVSELLKSIEFPFYQDICLLSCHAFDMLCQFDRMKVHEQSAQSSVTSSKNGCKQEKLSKIDKINELIVETQNSDAEMVESLVPILKQANKNIKFCLTVKHDNIKKTMNDWWELPAQKALEFMEVDGKTFPEWLKIWNLAIMQLQKETNV